MNIGLSVGEACGQSDHMHAALVEGWLMMAGLIVAIGAQNAQVLRQGLARQHIAPVVALCTVSDWVLVAAGVFGLGALLGRHPGWLQGVRFAGAAFLLWCGAAAARRAWAGGEVLGGGRPSTGRSEALAATAAMTWLNPHVYLDTVVLMGSVGAQHAGHEKAYFAAGAGLASLMWFAALGFGSAALAPRLARPGTWRVLDTGVAIVMVWLGLQLLLGPLAGGY